MPYDTKHLDLDNASLDEEGSLVVDEFKTTRNPDSDILKSGIPVDVTAEIISTKTYSEEYINSALDACNASSPRQQEWLDIKAAWDTLQ